VGTSLEDLAVLKSTEVVTDDVWRLVSSWNNFSRDSVGIQLVRAGDSIGANIAEAFGRFHYGEKIQFLYYARGSLFETKYWLNRSLARGLVNNTQAEKYADQLTGIARQLNNFVSSLKSQRCNEAKQSNVVSEPNPAYIFNEFTDESLFTQDDLDWLATNSPDGPASSNLQSPISNLQLRSSL
jgi:four helix bundle protein